MMAEKGRTLSQQVGERKTRTERILEQREREIGLRQQAISNVRQQQLQQQFNTARERLQNASTIDAYRREYNKLSPELQQRFKSPSQVSKENPDVLSDAQVKDQAEWDTVNRLWFKAQTGDEKAQRTLILESRYSPSFRRKYEELKKGQRAEIYAKGRKGFQETITIDGQGYSVAGEYQGDFYAQKQKQLSTKSPSEPVTTNPFVPMVSTKLGYLPETTVMKSRPVEEKVVEEKKPSVFQRRTGLLYDYAKGTLDLVGDAIPFGVKTSTGRGEKGDYYRPIILTPYISKEQDKESYDTSTKLSEIGSNILGERFGYPVVQKGKEVFKDVFGISEVQSIGKGAISIDELKSITEPSQSVFTPYLPAKKERVSFEEFKSITEPSQSVFTPYVADLDIGGKDDSLFNPTQSLESVKQKAFSGEYAYQDTQRQAKAKRFGYDVELEKKANLRYQKAFEQSEYARRYRQGSLDWDSAIKLFSESDRAKAIQKIYQAEYNQASRVAGFRVEDLNIAISSFGTGLLDFYTPTSVGEVGVLSATSMAFSYKPVIYSASIGGVAYGTKTALDKNLQPDQRILGGIIAGFSGAILTKQLVGDIVRYENKPILKRKDIVIEKEMLPETLDKYQVKKGESFSKLIKETETIGGLRKQVFDVRQKRVTLIKGYRTEITSNWRQSLGLRPKSTGVYNDRFITYEGLGFKVTQNAPDPLKLKITNYLKGYNFSDKAIAGILKLKEPRIIIEDFTGVSSLYKGDVDTLATKGLKKVYQPRVLVDEKLGIYSRGATPKAIQTDAVGIKIGSINNKDVYYSKTFETYLGKTRQVQQIIKVDKQYGIEFDYNKRVIQNLQVSKYVKGVKTITSVEQTGQVPRVKKFLGKERVISLKGNNVDVSSPTIDEIRYDYDVLTSRRRLVSGNDFTRVVNRLNKVPKIEYLKNDAYKILSPNPNVKKTPLSKTFAPEPKVEGLNVKEIKKILGIKKVEGSSQVNVRDFSSLNLGSQKSYIGYGGETQYYSVYSTPSFPSDKVIQPLPSTLVTTQNFLQPQAIAFAPIQTSVQSTGLSSGLIAGAKIETRQRSNLKLEIKQLTMQKTIQDTIQETTQNTAQDTVQDTVQRTRQRTRQRTVQEVIQEPVITPNVTPRPNITPTTPEGNLGAFLFPDFRFPSLKEKVKKKGKKKGVGLRAYLPSFSARALGLAPERVTLKQAEKKLTQTYTGAEIRRALLITR